MEISPHARRPPDPVYGAALRGLLTPLGVESALTPFKRVPGFHRQRAFQVWHGRNYLGRHTAQLIAAATGLPLGTPLILPRQAAPLPDPPEGKRPQSPKSGH